MRSDGSLNQGQHSEDSELLEYLLAAEGIEVSEEKRIVHRSSFSATPLSFAQERLWFLDQLQPVNSVYNIAIVLRAFGPLQVDALQRSLSEIVRRHETLRTRFVMTDGGPVQVVDPPAEFPLPLLDVSSLETEQREKRAAELSAEEAQRPFDLGRGPLIRALLIKLGAERHLLLLNQHHIVSDGWSVGVLWQELGELYQAYAKGKESPLPELPVQYGDYAVWQREWLKGEVLEEALGFWKKQLEKIPEVLELPTDRPRPEVQSFKGEIYVFSLPAALTQELKSVARRENVTLFMALCAAFEVLLARYSGQQNFALGTPHANRDRTELEKIIGFFINMLVLPAHVSGNPRFPELLALVRESTLAAYSYQYLPFEKLVDELGLNRNLGRSPLFQVGFALQNTAQPALEFGGLRFEPMPVSIGASKYDLTLFMAESEGRLAAMIEYSSDLFDASTIERMMRSYRRLLQGVVSNPQAHVWSLPVLDEDEAQQVLAVRNGPHPEILSQVFLDVVFSHRFAERLALVSHGNTLTYGDIAQQVGGLAARLRTAGAGFGDRVAICLEGTLDWVVASLAVLKIGGVFVALDPKQPERRCRFIIQDSTAGWVVSEKRFAHLFERSSSRWIDLHEQIAEESYANEDEKPLTYDSRTPACILYRPGAAGRLQGIVLPLGAFRTTGLVSGSDRVALKLNLSHEITPLELFAVMGVGACVIDLPDLPPRKLADLLRTQAVTVLLTSAAVLQRLATEFPRSLIQVRLILCAEETKILHRLRAVLSPDLAARVFGLYGATESGGACLMYPISELDSADRIPVSARLAGSANVHVLDEVLNPIPEGMIGEIWIEGEGVALSFEGDPAATSANLVSGLVSSVPGTRFFRTGLRTCLRSGGLELRKRRDRLICIEGMRVGLQEIESVLLDSPDLVSAAVVAHEASGLTGYSLVAFVVPGERREVSAEDLKQLLREHLPQHMVPSRIVFLAAMPRTSHGDIDLHSLERMTGENEVAGSSFGDVGPRTPVEDTLAKIWAEIFGLERVGIHDNFFALGGDSILSILAVTRASRAGIQITARQMFERQTIAGLASVAKRGESAAADQGIVSGPVPLTPAQLWFFEQDFHDKHHFNQAVMLATRETVDPSALRQVVAAILRHHDALRMRFLRHQSEWRQEVATQEDVDRVFVRVQLNPAGGTRQMLLQLAAAEWQASLNLQDGPLMRVVLFELGGDLGQRILIVIHHLVVDGVSWRILLEDLEQGYRQFRSGRPIDFGPKTLSFQQWARRLQLYAQSQEVQQQTEYWRDLVQAPFKPLPRDRHDGENLVSSAVSVTIALGKEQTRSLLQQTPQVYRMQMHEVLITAFAMAVREWASHDALHIDLEGHGREEIGGNTDVARTGGWFTAIFPVSLNLQGVSGPEAALRTVKEQLRRVPGRGLGYGLLRFLKREDQLMAPSSEVIFNYLGQFDRVLESKGIFQGAKESTGGLQSLRATRSYLLEINSGIWEGQFQAECTYSANAYEHQTVEQLMNGFSRNLQLLIEHCRSTAIGSYTPSDFPFVNVSQGFLDGLSKENGEIEDIYPLISMQEDMLLQSVAAPQSGVYFEQLIFRVRGLQPEKFQLAWNQVINRHAALRARFAWTGLQRPVQIQNQHVEIEFEREDCKEATNGNHANSLEKFLLRDRSRGFDLGKSPLMRLTLIRSGPDDWVVWSFHHILLDGWSGPILMQEVFSCYQAVCQGRDAQLDHPADYGDYIRWRQRQNQLELEKFWRARLKDFPRPVGLSVETQDQTCDAVDVGRERVEFAGDTIKALENFARERQLTLNTVVQGMWALLLAAFTGTREVTFGAWGSGRSADVAQIEKIVGALISTLPVRTLVDEGVGLVAWLKRIQEEQVEQRQYETVDLTRMIEWRGMPHGSTMFHSVLVFENYPVSSSVGNQINESGVQVFDVQAREQTHYPLTLRVMPKDNLTLLLEYDQARYTKRAARQILAHFHQLLTAIAVNPNCQIHDLLFSPDQDKQAEGVSGKR